MERILSAPRWALVAVVATFTLAVAALVTGLSGSAHAATPQTAANAANWVPKGNGDNNDEECPDDQQSNDNNKHDNNNDNNNNNEDNETCPPTITTSTITITKTTTTTTTGTTPAMTALPVTGSSSSGGVLALVGAGLLMAGGVGMFGLRRLRDRRG
jgi:LPXTG-motif cell wall-anchored protein